MLKIDILLSTYNGENFIKEQLDSLLGQTFQNWQLLVRDDGSSDDTVKIVNEYMKQYPEKIIFIEDQEKHLGACHSFGKLMEHSDADYIMFCDQDDVWLEDKIESTLTQMQQLENEYPGKPVLVHTNLKVADEKLNVISDSLWKYQKLDPGRKSLNYLLVQNNVTGCTSMINKKLKEITFPIPAETVMHDWWIALTASAFGEIGYVNKSTILYRQHGKNEVGAKRYSFNYLISRVNHKYEAQQLLGKVLKQADAFLKKYGQSLEKGTREMLQSFSRIDLQGRFTRVKTINKYKLAKSGTLRNLGYMFFLFTYPKGRK